MRQRLQKEHGGRSRCCSLNPPRTARTAIKNSHILDWNSHILRELEQNPPPTNISNAKPAVKTDPNYHSFFKNDGNCTARSPKFLQRKQSLVCTWQPRSCPPPSGSGDRGQSYSLLLLPPPQRSSDSQSAGTRWTLLQFERPPL